MEYMPQDTAPRARVKADKRGLTTTSYAILGLLSVKPWSAYELTGQMKRGMRFTWPRAETRIYQEPKHLVAHGLARAKVERNGLRSRTVYSITPKGRAALRRWLTMPSAPPQLECEALVRATFTEAGTTQDLLRTMRELREQALGSYLQIADQAEDYLATGGPFPERLPTIVLVGKFILEYLAFLERYARWAETQLETWPTDGTVLAAPVAWDVLHDAVADAHARRAAREQANRTTARR
jgi:PadR family transcriptional regulator, regulatory protein AphA